MSDMILSDVSNNFDCVGEGSDRRARLLQIIVLSVCRRLANNKERGYRWKDGVLVHGITDCAVGEVLRVAVPKSRRNIILQLARDNLGHLGFRKMKDIIAKCFTWPNIGVHINNYCL